MGYSPNLEYDELEDDSCWHMQTLVTTWWSAGFWYQWLQCYTIGFTLAVLYSPQHRWSVHDTLPRATSWIESVSNLVIPATRGWRRKGWSERKKNDVSERCPSSIGSWWPRHGVRGGLKVASTANPIDWNTNSSLISKWIWWWAHLVGRRSKPFNAVRYRIIGVRSGSRHDELGYVLESKYGSRHADEVHRLIFVFAT